MDDNVRKIRGSLNTMSIAIILYMWAGGHIGTEDGKGKASFFGGSITFDHPEYLEVMALLIFLYLGVRWVLHSYDVLRPFAWEFATYFMCSERYLSIVMKDAPNIRYLFDDRERESYLIQVKKNSLKAVRGEMPRNISFRKPPIVNRIFFPSIVGFPHSNNVNTAMEHIRLWNSSGNEVIINAADSIKLTLLAVYSLFKFIFLWEKLYDLVVPYLLSGIAIYFLVAESDKGLGHILNIMFG